ncbi:MAG: hypothetical protein AAGB51_08410 [Planctomycetota bacterium]
MTRGLIPSRRAFGVSLLLGGLAAYIAGLAGVALEYAPWELPHEQTDMQWNTLADDGVVRASNYRKVGSESWILIQMGWYGTAPNPPYSEFIDRVPGWMHPTPGMISESEGLMVSTRITMIAGLPFRSIIGSYGNTPNVGGAVSKDYRTLLHLRQGKLMIPYGIKPDGFAANTVFYGSLFLTAPFIRRWHRLRHRRCMTCAYDLRDADPSGPCPECGAVPSISADGTHTQGHNLRRRHRNSRSPSSRSSD